MIIPPTNSFILVKYINHDVVNVLTRGSTIGLSDGKKDSTQFTKIDYGFLAPLQLLGHCGNLARINLQSQEIPNPISLLQVQR